MSVITKSPYKINHKRVKLIAFITLFIFCVVITYLWLVNVWQAERWQQALLTQNKTELTPPKKIMAKIKIPEVKEFLALEQITLPKAPALKTSTAKQSVVKTSSENKAQEKQPIVKEPTIKPVVVKKVPVKPRKISKPLTTKTPVIKKSSVAGVTKSKIPKKQKTQQIYQQLFSDQSLSIEIAWPNNASKRELLFTHLYQCVGMKFGVLKNQSVTLAPQRSNFVRNPQAQYSDWLRVAQGKLANQEQAWLREYNLNGTAVRLFPKKVDWQLAQYLTQELGNENLKSLRANYKLSASGLLLDNIYLNGIAVKKQWQLTQDSC